MNDRRPRLQVPWLDVPIPADTRLNRINWMRKRRTILLPLEAALPSPSVSALGARNYLTTILDQLEQYRG